MTAAERRTATTVSRRMAANLALALATMVVLVVIAVLALARVADAKDQVIDREARLVVDAHRLNEGLSVRGVAFRNFLLTGDDSYLDRYEQGATQYEQAFADLRSRAYRAEAVTLLEEIDRAKAGLDAVHEDLFEQRRTGTLTMEELSALIQGALTPARQAVTSFIETLIGQEEARIEQAVEDSDRTASQATWVLVGLGLAGIVLSLVVGARIAAGIRGRLTGVAVGIDSAAAEILAGTAQQVAGASQQAASVQETVATADELAQTADQSAERARTVADRAQRAAEVAESGTKAVDDTASVMDEIRGQVQAIADTVVSLAERTQAISGIVRSVDDIAEQTHLLALNASIEAARAGEHGRGFSVVAGEVRALADQSKRATVRIADILGEIQQGANTAVIATEEGGKSVAKGVERIDVTGSTIDELADTVAASAIAAEQISASAGQQAVATVQISQAMRDLDDATQQSAAAARQAEQAARDLNAAAADLKALVGAR